MRPKLSILSVSVLLLSAVGARAQTPALTGRLTDRDSREPLVKATVQLYRLTTKSQRPTANGRQTTDTAFVDGVLTDAQGRFGFGSVRSGDYLLKASYVGYRELHHRIAKTTGKTLDVGTLAMTPDAILLSEAVATANLPKMVVKDDTIVYNADAFRVPEGSVIEALVEALPGAKIDDDGGITINGKNVKRFKMDGRDFMTGNNNAVMKNLPSYVIDKVKAYDEKSDLAKLTGVDDGNEDFVLEFVTKRSARRGLQMNPDVGYGTDDRYGMRLTAMKPFGDVRYTFMGNANNVNDRNFTGRGGRGRGNNNGQRETKTAALDISYENGRNLKTSGRVTWNRSDADNWSRTGAENFVKAQRGGAFSNSISQSYQRQNSWTANMNVQWNVDTLSILSFRPNISIGNNDSRSFSTSASFNDDPFEYVDNPLDAAGLAAMDSMLLAVNSRRGRSLGYGNSHSASAQMQLFRRLSRKGRNAAITSSVNYSDGNNESASLSAVHLYQQMNQAGQDSTYQTNRYTKSDSKSYSFSLGATYTEPLIIFKAKPLDSLQMAQQRAMRRGGGGRGGRGGGGGTGTQGLFLQMSYRYSHSYQKSDPATYDFPDYADADFDQMLQGYRDWAMLFGLLDNPYEQYLSDRLSRYSERTEDNHDIEMQLRLVREKMNLNAGIQMQPQHAHYIQQYLGRPVDTLRTVTNISPTLNMRYRFNQQTNLQVQLRGQSQQPSITQLLDIYDDTNPLNISMGNPGLKPSFTTNMQTNFQMQRKPALVEDSLGQMVPRQQRHWSFSTNASLQTTSNAIGNVVTYNETSGGRITRPENINGNWSTNGGMTFNINLDTLNRWDVSGSIRGTYRHQIGYVNLNRTAVPDRNVTHTWNLSPSTSISFRNAWLHVALNGNMTYARTENELQASRNLSTWNFSYGGTTQIKMPWGMTLNTDIHMFSKRGYSDQTLNTNELIWNMQLSQGFMRGKRLTVMLRWYDILNRQSNFTRNVTANGWTDREVNTITSYAMLHVSYRLNFFKGRGNNRGEGERWGGEGPRRQRDTQGWPDGERRNRRGGDTFFQ